jgi:ferritin
MGRNVKQDPTASGQTGFPERLTTPPGMRTFRETPFRNNPFLPQGGNPMIGERLAQAMNDQIKHELESYYIYLSMAAYFHSRSLDGMGHWMRCQAHEEMTHAMKFFDHVIDRGGSVTLQNLAQLKTEWASPLEAFKDALAHEQFISGKVNELITIAREERDYASEPLLNWFSDEQIEEEATAGKIADELEMVGDDKSGLLMIDRELAQRAFGGGSALDPSSYSAE